MAERGKRRCGQRLAAQVPHQHSLDGADVAVAVQLGRHRPGPNVNAQVEQASARLRGLQPLLEGGGSLTPGCRANGQQPLQAGAPLHLAVTAPTHLVNILLQTLLAAAGQIKGDGVCTRRHKQLAGEEGGGARVRGWERAVAEHSGWRAAGGRAWGATRDLRLSGRAEPQQARRPTRPPTRPASRPAAATNHERHCPQHGVLDGEDVRQQPHKSRDLPLSVVAGAAGAAADGGNGRQQACADRGGDSRPAGRGDPERRRRRAVHGVWQQRLGAQVGFGEREGDLRVWGLHVCRHSTQKTLAGLHCRDQEEGSREEEEEKGRDARAVPPSPTTSSTVPTRRSNDLAVCKGCSIVVHQECYGIEAVPQNYSWFCRRCEPHSLLRASKVVGRRPCNLLLPVSLA